MTSVDATGREIDEEDKKKYPDRWSSFGYLYHREDPVMQGPTLEERRNAEKPKVAKRRPLIDGRGLAGVRV